MCFGKHSVQHLLEWLKGEIEIYKEIYNDATIPTIENVLDFRKYCRETKRECYNKFAFLAMKKGLQPLNFNDTEIKKLVEFMERIKQIHKKFISKTGRKICISPYFFVHYCFPEKNIIPDYCQLSPNKEHIYENTWDTIKSLIE